VVGTQALARSGIQFGMSSVLHPPMTCRGGGRALGYLPGPTQLHRLRLETDECDVVMIHGLWTVVGCLAAHFAQRSGKPYVIAPHGMLDRWALSRGSLKKRLFGFLVQRRALERAAALRFLNDDELREAKEYGISAPAFVMPNGVSTEDLAELPSRAEPGNDYHHLHGKIVVLFLGRLHPKKGLRLLIAAFAKARQQCPALHLVIAGPDEGGHRRQVEQWTAEYNLAGAVSLPGMVLGQAKRQVWGAADIFVLPSYQEGDSQAIKEAMAAGLPVVITRACHFDAVERSGAGLVIDTEASALEAALLKLAADGALRHKMGARARGLIEAQFTWVRLAGQLRQVLDDILRGHPTSPAWRLTDKQRLWR
jgi:glycosyltransferase involved in cell wall biosynthesis